MSIKLCKTKLRHIQKGIFGAPACPGEMFTVCEIIRRLLSLGAYTDPIQDILIQAQVWLTNHKCRVTRQVLS